ncbi:kinase-like domain-containing protein [Ilyonectria robusta]|uniref:kinase-like domain-containing protein n=1 Tax=Ilyonectria robusta TaxID=1079257 RepID=UPI001E8E3D94|nr:kinase-like domain-containing protein [Ilyonectria robusta]KAH8661821.1 kinase-like domain-containing protein [Ilyonectria robusta]
MASFFDAPISDDYFFVNAPCCRTRREATLYYLHNTHFVELQPPTDTPVEVLHQIAHPFSMGSVTDRQIVIQIDGDIRKSVRIGRSNLSAEKSSLELVRARTSIPVPFIHQYYLSADYEHLVMSKMPGVTLETAWPMLSPHEREFIADEVVSLIRQLRTLHSPHIQAALLQRQPLRAGIKNSTEFNMERIKDYLWDQRITDYIRHRSIAVTDEPNVFTHGDLDWGNIMITDKRVSGIIDLESSGYFPAYWEWVTVKRLSQGLPSGSWFRLLEQRLRKEKLSGWDGMWEVEKLISALDSHSQWALTPEDRERNRVKGWAEVGEILGVSIGDPPPVTYVVASQHPWWLELVNQR